MLMRPSLSWAKQFDVTMLKILHSAHNLDFKQLQEIYSQTENDFFYEDTLDFLAEQESVYCIWVVDGVYVSALRWQRFCDGYLIAGIETKSCERRKGYAQQLLEGVLEHFKADCGKNVYSHIRKNNQASIDLHSKCGFSLHTDYARLLDGSVSRQYSTYMIRI